MEQSIKCSVKTCKFQLNEKCSLDEIKVGNSKEEATKKDETACKSFECEDGQKNKEGK